MRQCGNRRGLVGVCARSRTRAAVESEDSGDAASTVSTIVGVLSEGLAIVVVGVLHKEIVVEVSEGRWTEQIGVSGADGGNLSKRAIGSLVHATTSRIVTRAHLVVADMSSRAWVSAHTVRSW